MLLKREANNSTVFVFPSEAAAVAWKKQFLKINRKKAVRNERFISWDSFKETITLHNRVEKPVNSVIRRLFAAKIIEDNAKDIFFTKIIPPNYAHSAEGFTESICRILPELKKLVELISQKDCGTHFPSEDFRKLYHCYLDFMRKNTLFEPSWNIPNIDNIKRKYYIIAPNIIEDFNELSSLLKKAGCEFFYPDTYSSNAISVFENSAIEIDYVLNKVSDLLKKDICSYEIAISCADDETVDTLMSVAKLRGVPLKLRSGKPLIEYPAGRLPYLLFECINSNFSLTSMKNLLLFRAYTWKEAEKVSQLVRFGIEHRCLKNTGAGIYDDEWEQRLSSAKEYDLLKFYKSLKKRITSFCKSKSFNKLALELQIFITNFLITDSNLWNSESEMVFQSCREVLSVLCQLENDLKEINIKNPLALWIKILNEKIYVHKLAQGGISVYKYRVSALINPKYHFICGVSHEKSKISTRPFSFLTDQQRELLCAIELNMTEDFLKIYGMSGENIFFSCALETYSGSALVPAFFIKKETQIKEASIQADPTSVENQWWKAACYGEYGENPNLSILQKEGFNYALQTFIRTKEHDVSRNIIAGNNISKKLLENLSNKEGYIKISSTALSQWLNCPFAFFLERALKIQENDYLLLLEDPLEEGNIYHRIFYLFFDNLKKSGESFCTALSKDQYKKQITKIAKDVYAEWEKSKNYFFGPAWTAFKKRCLYLVSQFILEESKLFDGFYPSVIEENLQLTIEEKKIIIHGFVDRISIKEQEAVLIDYKRNWGKKSKKKFIKYDEDENLLPPELGYQIPLYIMLANDCGINITKACYYGVSQAEYFPVLGDGGVLDKKEISALCSKALEDITVMAEKINASDFRAPKRCEGCSLRAICRKRFNVGWSE